MERMTIKRLAFFALLIAPPFCVQLAFAAESMEPMGRLFSTQLERDNLDYLRATQKKAPVVIDNGVQEMMVEVVPAELPDAISVQGYVKRYDGKQGTVWVNGDALQEGAGNKDVQIGRLPASGSRVPIRIPANGKRLTLKAGQVYDPETGSVREARSYASQGNSGTIGH